jgi:hypothetical protein
VSVALEHSERVGADVTACKKQGSRLARCARARAGRGPITPLVSARLGQVSRLEFLYVLCSATSLGEQNVHHASSMPDRPDTYAYAHMASPSLDAHRVGGTKSLVLVLPSESSSRPGPAGSSTIVRLSLYPANTWTLLIHSLHYLSLLDPSPSLHPNHENV